MERIFKNGIPISISLASTLKAENIRPKITKNKERIFLISALSLIIAICASFVAKLLIFLIDLITNIVFHGNFSIAHSNPADNTLGYFVILVPAVGGVIIGLMAFYGSKAIRGHGIPEAMEQILTNKSRIKPAITYLKPLSSALSIGTGGPFGAEGPIIATGGALGSTIGQLLNISHNERKILLTAGATAGMSAIFGSPLAAIFLAIELLLFEFSPRSIIPVALACIMGAIGHRVLFGQEVVFPVKDFILSPSNLSLAFYCIVGILIGMISVVVTKIVYGIEDSFEKLPIHWMWWPSIGGLLVGVVGYFSPRTLGVGYNNIVDVLSGDLSVQFVLTLCILKFVSWAIALGSGTSGGTLAPLLTIGGSAGALLGTMTIYFFPQCGVTIPLAALVGMSAMFAGASRAVLTSILFALETTGQSNALFPLLIGCTASYVFSFFTMKNTIMTEKIARRGVKTPDSYEADLLEKITVKEVVNKTAPVLDETNTIKDVCEWLRSQVEQKNDYFILSNADGEYSGLLDSSKLYNYNGNPEFLIGTLVKHKDIFIGADHSLREAVELMAIEGMDALPVFSSENDTFIGIISYQEIISAYKSGTDEHDKKRPHISLKRRRLKIIVRGKKIFANAELKNK